MAGEMAGEFVGEISSVIAEPPARKQIAAGDSGLSRLPRSVLQYPQGESNPCCRTENPES